jgi:multicomponent Na+:H+ antiporter subunit D
MITHLLEVVPWARAGPGWAHVAILLAMTGAAFTLLLRERPALKRAAGFAVWGGMLVLLIFALRGRMPGPPPIAGLDGDRTSLLVTTGITLAGIFAWLLGGAAVIAEDRRQSIAPLVFALIAASIGAVTASDLLVLTVWQFALGACAIGFSLLLRRQGEADPARSLMVIEAICLFGTGVALALMGGALPAAHAVIAAAIGLGLMLLVLIVRLGSLIITLPLVARARAPVLAAEIAIAGIAIPAILQTLIALTLKFHVLAPSAFTSILVVGAVFWMIVGGLLAIGARGRPPRIAAIAASLVGLALLGACEGSKTALLFVLLWLGPVPAFLAASSIAGRIDRGGASIVERTLTPQGDAIALLLAMASLALVGLPPFAGFWARLMLVEAAWAHADYAIVAVTLLSSLILAFALSRRAFERVPAMADAERRNYPPGIALPELLVLGVMSGLSLAGGLYPAPFVHTDQSVSGLVAPLRADLSER